MKCADCVYYECSMRSYTGGCSFGELVARREPAPPIMPENPFEVTDAVEVAASVAYLASRGWILIKPGEDNIVKKVKALRDAQNMHAKTLNYGYRCLAIRLGKEVDEMLDKLKIK